MKKLICLLTVLALLLCGCGGTEKPVSGQVTPVETEAAPQQTQAPETAPTENPVSLGRMEGGVYTNEYVGYGCTLDSNWVFYSAEELQELPENIAELMEGSELGDTMDQYTQISDMAAENVNELITMNVQYTKLNMQERIAYAMLTEEQILQEVLGQKDMMVAAYEQAGITVYDMELVEVTFLGQSRMAIHTTAEIQGVAYFILQIFDHHLGQYSVVTTFGSYVEDKTESMLELFYPLS